MRASSRAGLGLAAALLAGLVSGMAPRPSGWTMMVVPARYTVLQVAFDMARRFPVIVVSYQPRGEEGPLLHAWDGRDWTYLTLDEYRNGGFLRVRPARAVLVGGAELLPEQLIEASRWCPLVLNLRALDTPGLINGMGQILRFRAADWKWFSARYNMPLIDRNAELRRKSWYDHAPEEVLPWLQEDRGGGWSGLGAPGVSAEPAPEEASGAESIVEEEAGPDYGPEVAEPAGAGTAAGEVEEPPLK
ncbi:MAG TPA: hypothetical protein EYP62_07105 [Kiritimatiellae bacterium]|nr:hypothetical protein [Kiritimatiellia bacterium]